MSDLPVVIRGETAVEAEAIDRLNERAFGPGRFARSAYRLREAAAAAQALSFVAHVGTLLVGSNRMTPVDCGGQPALLLGPLAVDPAFRSRGIGEALVRVSLDAARAKGHSLVILVGDEPYYARIGFKRVPPGRLLLPGPVAPERLLYCELTENAFAGASGLISPDNHALPRRPS
jgi:predicted N-acetyltransferase YhbS